MEKLQSMRRAAGQVDRVLSEHFPAWVTEGVSELEVFERLSTEIQADGRYGLSFDPIVAFDAGAAEPHHIPTRATVKSGSIILIDCGAMYGEWCSDCTRMFSFGMPSDEFLQKYKLVLGAHMAALPQFIAGAKCAELDGFVRQFLREDAAFFVHTLGHGVGKEVHVSPRIGPDSLEILQKGESVTCEPGIYFPKKFGIRIEDQLFIQKDEAPEIITNLPRKLGIIDDWGTITYLP